MGGKWGLQKVIPFTGEGGKPTINPGFLGTLVVALILLSFSLFYFNNAFGYYQLASYQIAGWIIPSIFFIRAVGEFKYVGFFKRVRGTEFSKMDTVLFSPLCLLVAVLGFWLQLTS